jgi:hypothetical protein
VSLQGLPHADQDSVHEYDAHEHPASLTADVHRQVGHDDHKCSACAACCSVSVLLMSSVPTIPALDASPAMFSAVACTVGAFIADGPERPPRPLLA